MKKTILVFCVIGILSNTSSAIENSPNIENSSPTNESYNQKQVIRELSRLKAEIQELQNLIIKKNNNGKLPNKSILGKISSILKFFIDETDKLLSKKTIIVVTLILVPLIYILSVCLKTRHMLKFKNFIRNTSRETTQAIVYISNPFMEYVAAPICKGTAEGLVGHRFS